MFGVAALIAVALGSLTLSPVREWARAQLPLRWKVHLNGFRFGYETDYSIRTRMADGIELASTLYLPRSRNEKLVTIFLRHPCDRLM